MTGHPLPRWIRSLGHRWYGPSGKGLSFSRRRSRPVPGRRPVLPRLEILEDRTLPSSTPGLPDLSNVRNDLAQFRNDLTASTAALVNTLQPSSTNTPTLGSVQSQWSKAWNTLAVDWSKIEQAFVQVESALLGAVQREFDMLLGIPLPGQSSSPSPPTPSSPDASPAVAVRPKPNPVLPIRGDTAGSLTTSKDPIEIYNTPGTWTWTSPLTGTLTVQAWGSGGGGSGYSTAPGGGYGGGGGGYAKETVSVIAGDNYSIVVGAGGSGGTSQGASGTAGGNSTFALGSTTYLTAGGGGGGSNTSDGAAGIYSGTGVTGYDGGTGGGPGTPTYNPGGGGGGGAGSGGNGGGGGSGTSSSGGAGGSAGTPDGGTGGAGGNTGANGSNGHTLGGGGGGGGNAAGKGGNGANGEVQISWGNNNEPLLTAATAEPGSLLQANTDSTGPTIASASADVRYADGVATIAATDLQSDGFGFTWGQTRSWSNGAGYATGSVNGFGWVDTYIPHLLQADGSTNNTLIFIANGGTAYYYDLTNGVYQSHLDDGTKLTYNSGNDTFTLIDTQGDQIVLNGFTNPLAAKHGEFASYADPYGTQMVASYTTDGHIAEMQRSATIGSNTTTESYLYSYLPTGPNAGLLSNVTLRTKVNTGAWSTVRQVNYAYYDGTQSGGNPGDLMTATVEDGSSNVMDTSYYRYYKSGETNGYTHGLKYVFNPDSYLRLSAAAAALHTSVSNMTDAQVAPYADNYFQYNSAQQVSQETVQGAGDSQTSSGGLGTYGFIYNTSTNPQGADSWNTDTVVTNPDGSTDTVYTNAFAEVLFDDHYEPSGGGSHTYEAYQYSPQGQLILDAAPSAVLGYSPSYADLIHNETNKEYGYYQYLNNNNGPITIYTYDTTTTATETQAGFVAGYLDEEFLSQGQLNQGNPWIRQETYGYYAHSYNGQTIAPVASTGLFRGNTIQTGEQPTFYFYTWYSGTAQLQSEQEDAPLISSTTENGPGTADVTTTLFDTYGNAQWIKDPDGYIENDAYDPVTGALLTQVVDDNTNLPTGWTAPGGDLNLTTSYVVDALGRTTKETSPNDNITYYVYLDPQHEERIYAGWNSGTNTATQPTQVIRHDATDSYDETFTMTAAPHVTNGAPDGTEAISGLQTLTRDYTNATGQTTADYVYFNLGGLTYSTGTMGTVNVNYYQTNYGYDSAGRLVRTQTPNGTIYRTVYNSLDEKVSDWVGTNDTPTSGEWSPTNNTGTANMVEVSSYQYDNGGVGDGNLTQETDYPGLGAANRVTNNWYDWRDRVVATKSGVQGNESDGTNRLIIVYTYDNLDEVTETQQYTGDGVTPTISNGVLSPLAATSLRAQEIDSYDDQQRIYQKQVYDVSPTNGAVSTTALTTNDYYDHRGDLIAESAPGGLWSKSQYDGAGRDKMDYTTDGAGGTMWAEAGSVTNDTVLEQSQTVYDSDGNVIETIDSQRFHNASGTGPLGNPTSGIGARVSYAASYYDNADRLTADVNVGTNGGTAWTRPGTAPASSATVLTTTYQYNSMGLVQEVTDPMGINSFTVYDNLGRTIKTIDNYTNHAETVNSDIATEYTYDGNNNVTSVQADEPGTSYQKTAYVYGVTTAGGSGVNSNDILAKVQHPDPTTGQPGTSSILTESYLVNALGQNVQYKDRNQNVHQYSYDVLGRLTSDYVQTLGGAVDGTVRQHTYAYDSQGNQYLISSLNSTGGVVNQVEDVFNGLDQLTGEYQSHSGAVVPGTTPEVQYNYNEMQDGHNNSRLQYITYPDGYKLYYNYNSGLDSNISRLSSLSDIENNLPVTLESYLYLGLDTVVERDHQQNNVNLTYIAQQGQPQTGDAGDRYVGLDRFGRVVDHNWYNTTTQTSTDRWQYGYNQDGDVLYKQNLVESTVSELYQYDSLHRITNFQRGTLNSTHNGIVGTASDSQSWTLDALGNFTGVTTNGTSDTRTINQQNQDTNISTGGAIGYDNNGNLSNDYNLDGFTYDAWNRLAYISNGGTAALIYSYDGLGRLIGENVPDPLNPTTTDQYYSSSGQVLETYLNGTPQARYVWSPVYVNALVLRDRSSNNDGNLNEERLYVQQDANWNVTALVDKSGNVVERYQYMPYGALTVLNSNFTIVNSSFPDQDPLSMLFFWQGMEYDSTPHLYFSQSGRVSSPTLLMTWLQSDPSGFGGGDVNLYRIEGNNPTNTLDPLGLGEPVTTAVLTGAAAKTGAAAAAGGTAATAPLLVWGGPIIVGVGLTGWLGYESYQLHLVSQEAAQIPARMMAAKQAGQVFATERIAKEAIKAIEKKVKIRIATDEEGCPNIPPAYFADEKGRASKVIAIVGPHTERGKDWDRRVYPPWWNKLPKDVKWQRGHLLAQSLGGLGGRNWANLVALTPAANQDWKGLEDSISRAMKYECLIYIATAHYEGDNLYLYFPGISYTWTKVTGRILPPAR
jgi:RHS repeat-associated protein